MSNYIAHQMGRDTKHRQPIIGIFNSNQTLIRSLDVLALCDLYAKYRLYLKTLRDISQAKTLEDAQELAKLALQGDTEDADNH